MLITILCCLRPPRLLRGLRPEDVVERVGEILTEQTATMKIRKTENDKKTIKKEILTEQTAMMKIVLC